MGVVVRLPNHWCTSRGGRGTCNGQPSGAGQFSENQIIVFSSRRTWMSAPRSSAPSFLVSPSARQLTVDKSMRAISAYACATERSWSIPVMTEISVKLPHSSRVMLPHAEIIPCGYPTGMKAKDNIRIELLKWIDEGLSKTSLSESAAEKKAGHPSAIRNLRKGKSQSWQTQIIRAFIGIFGEPPAALMSVMFNGAPTRPANHTLSIDEVKAELAASERHSEELRTTIRIMEQLSKRTG